MEASTSASHKHQDHHHQHDLETPLLPLENGDCEDQQEPTNILTCYTNLTKVILGAGVMAIPKAVAMSGSVLGGTLLLLVGILTWYTVMGLVRGSRLHCLRSYGSLTETLLGRAASKVLQLAVVATCVGFLVVYYDIILDSLLGMGSCEGVIAQALPLAWRNTVWTTRPVALAILLVLVVVPNVLRKSMSHLGVVNAIGLLSLLGFAASMVWLAAAAVYHGQPHTLPLGPDLPALGRGTAHRLIRMASLVPIILTADSCHHAIHPVMQLLKPYNTKSMSYVVAMAVGTATLLHATVSVSAYVAFGEGVQEDVLNNLDVPTMSPLIGETCANVVAICVRLGYVVSLLGNALLMMFPLRETVAQLMLGRPGDDHKDALFKRVLTLTLLAIIYVITVFVPSMWDIISIVGSFSSTIICFIVPGAIVYVIDSGPTAADARGRALGLFVAGLGAVLLVNGIATSWIGIDPRV